MVVCLTLPAAGRQRWGGGAGCGRTGPPPFPRPIVVFHDLTHVARRLLADDVIGVVIDQNARRTGEQAVIRLPGSIAPVLTLKDIGPRIIPRKTIPGP